ncbi:50S ribosomal protein L19 [Patescibacteria group bacterium]|nr:50S ribosomal protein L19 [Patescibacteria group bacterium]
MANRIKINDTVFAVGDTVVIYQKIQEEKKMRTQPFEGIVIGIKGRDENKSFTVRKIGAGGIGVERIWPVSSPWIEKIEVKRKGKVRRAKLYYLRERVGKKAVKIKAKDEKKKPRQPRRKSRPKTSKK